MPRRSKKTDEAIGTLILIVLAILVILFLIVILTPLFLLFGLIIYIIKSHQFRNKIQGNKSDFWLNNNQKTEFRHLFEIMDNANIGINEANKIATNRGIARNLDGSISARSKAGKELRKTIVINKEIIDEKLGDFNTLKNLPISQWEKFRRIYTRKYSFVFGLVFYVASALILIKAIYGNLIMGIENFISFPSKLFNASLIEDNDITIMLITIGSSVFAYLIASLIFRKRAIKLSPIPPIVNIHNVDKY